MKSLKRCRRTALVSVIAILLLAISFTSCDLLDVTNGYAASTTTTTTGTPTADPVGTGSVTLDQYKSPDIPSDAGTYAYVARVASPSVVSITTEATVYSNYGTYIESGAGSGVILCTDASGEYTYIITNNHVVEGRTTITVYLNGETTGRPAVFCGGDWQSDIAVIRIDGADFTCATLGNSAELLLGQEVAAIGNPLGRLGGTVTDGIISCLSRTIVFDGVPLTLIQHSASISPGNSGGGLFNLYGQLIGIVSGKTSGTGVEGISYAIPIDLALDRAVQIIEQGYVSGTPALGLSYTQETSNGIVISSYKYNDELEATNQNTLQAEDVLAVLGGKSITSVDDVRSVLSQVEPGDVIEATFIRFVSYYRYTTFTVNLTVHEYVPDGVSTPPADTPSDSTDGGDMEFD